MPLSLAWPPPQPHAPAEWRQALGLSIPLPREAISSVCEAVPGAKGATRRRKVPGSVGLGMLGDVEEQGEG